MLKPGDRVWIGPMAILKQTGPVDYKLEQPRCAMTPFNTMDSHVELLIPDVPNLAHIARFLAGHPETVDALGPAIDHLKGMIPHYEEWEASALAQPLDVISQEGRDLMAKWVVDAKSEFALLFGLQAAMRGEEAGKERSAPVKCEKPILPADSPWDDLVDSGIEIHFICGNFVTIPQQIVRHAQAMNDASRCTCPYCGSPSGIIQRVHRLRNDTDTPIISGGS